MPRRPRRTITLTTTVAAEIPVTTRSTRSMAKNILQSIFNIKFTRYITKVVTIPVGSYT